MCYIVLGKRCGLQCKVVSVLMGGETQLIFGNYHLLED